MDEPLPRLRRFLDELRRRRVYRVAVTYAVVAFVLIQVADLTFVRLGLPGWSVTLVIALAAIGFPLALVLAWAFEITPEGVRRTGFRADQEADGEARAGAGYRALLALGLLAAAAVGGWYLTGAGGGEAPRAGERSVAVLPFETLGEDETDPFTEGMHDALLTRLSNVGGLDVISRTSVQAYRDTEKPLPRIARELGVRWVLEGGVQRLGDQIQVNAQLIDPRTDTHAWAESYQRELTAENLFAIQGELTKRIAASLEARLTAGETERVDRRPTEDLEAYRLYVQGRARLDRRTEEGMRSSLEFFGRALERDSTFALAWSGLADARALLASYEFAPADSTRREGLDAVRRALELDPELAEAHASRGLLLQGLRRDGPGAAREYRRAIELRPSYARAHHWLGLLLRGLGRREQGLASLRRAAELDPRSPPILVALANGQRLDGRLEAALETTRRAGALGPDYVTPPLFRGMILMQMGRLGEARDVLTELRASDGLPPGMTTPVRALLAVAHLRSGDTARAEELRSSIEPGEDLPFTRAAVEAEFGDVDGALDALRRGEPDVEASGMIRYDPLLDPVRGDPRFREILRTTNVSWGLDPDGSFPASD